MIVNIWTSVECAAWCRDFNYEEYLDLHNKRGEIGSPLKLKGYYALCRIFDDELESE